MYNEPSTLRELEDALRNAEENSRDYTSSETDALAAFPERWKDKAFQVYFVIAATVARIGEDGWQCPQADAFFSLTKLNKAVPIPPEAAHTLKVILDAATNNPTAECDGTDDYVLSLRKFLTTATAEEGGKQNGNVKKALDDMIQEMVGTAYKNRFFYYRPETDTFHFPSKPIENLITAYLNMFGINSETGFRAQMPDLIDLGLENERCHVAAIAAKVAAGNEGKIDLGPFNGYLIKNARIRDAAFDAFINRKENKSDAESTVKKLEKIAGGLEALYCEFGNQLNRNIGDEIRLMAYRIADPAIDNRFYRSSVRRIGFQYLSKLLVNNTEAKGTPATELLQPLPPVTRIMFKKAINDECVYLQASGRFGAYTHSKILNSLAGIHQAFFSSELPAPIAEEVQAMRDKLEKAEAQPRTHSNL